MNIPTKPGHYRSFLLRLWLDGDAHRWRFSLEDPHTSKRVGFQNLEELIAFLNTWIQNLTKGEEIENHKS